MSEAPIIVTVEKWQVSPEPKWVFLRTKEVQGIVTPKRIKADGHTFDLLTGREIKQRGFHSFYKFSAKIKEAQTP